MAWLGSGRFTALLGRERQGEMVFKEAKGKYWGKSGAGKTLLHENRKKKNTDPERRKNLSPEEGFIKLEVRGKRMMKKKGQCWEMKKKGAATRSVRKKGRNCDQVCGTTTSAGRVGVQDKKKAPDKKEQHIGSLENEKNRGAGKPLG